MVAHFVRPQLTKIEKITLGFWKCGARELEAVWLTDFVGCQRRRW